MKNMLKTALFAAGLFVLSGAYAQAPKKDPSLGDKIGHTAKTVGHATSTAAKSVGHATATTATKVGHKTSEIAAKGDAAVVDKRYEGKVAPNGEAVYINNKRQYYYVNKKGHRVYLRKSELRNKR
jgi:hypothetical protein